MDNLSDEVFVSLNGPPPTISLKGRIKTNSTICEQIVEIKSLYHDSLYVQTYFNDAGQLLKHIISNLMFTQMVCLKSCTI